MSIVDRFFPRGAWRLPLLVLCLVLANSVMFWSSIERLRATTSAVTATLALQRDLAEGRALLVTAEVGQRGYLLTGDPRQLAPFHEALAKIGPLTSTVRGDLRNDSPLQLPTDKLAELSSAKLAQIAESVRLFGAGQRDEAVALMREDSGGETLMEQIQQIGDGMSADIDRILQEQEAANMLATLISYFSAGIFVAGMVGLLAALHLRTTRQLRERSVATAELRRYADTLDASVAELEQERNGITAVHEAGSFLQTCNSVRELAQLVPTVLGGLLPGVSGEVSIYAASRNQLVSLASWGDWTSSGVLTPDACWALRGGHMHHHLKDGRRPACAHIAPTEARDTLCVPMLAHGETAGLLTLAGPGLESPDVQRSAEMIARQIALTVANLKLRETLNEQSVRDPLTQVFNRRYLDSVGSKELAHAARNNEPLAVVMIDVDHFKRFNDMHGHAAGDVALTAVASHVQHAIREADWMFRYGGEEFVLLLRAASEADAARTCEELRGGVARLNLSYDGQSLPSVTISMGVTITRGETRELLAVIRRADEALYAAKRAGRNRVAFADAGQPVPEAAASAV